MGQQLVYCHAFGALATDQNRAVCKPPLKEKEVKLRIRSGKRAGSGGR